MLEHLRWPLGIELVQHSESAELNEWVTAELQGVILSLLSIEENYESLYVVCSPEGYRSIHDTLFYEYAAAKLAVDKTIS